MSDRIVDYYVESYNEDRRHTDPFGIIQEIRTKQLLERFITQPQMNILDIGGATGIYSFFLADLGHNVTLLDIAPNHIKIAKSKNFIVNNKLKNIILADALKYETEETFDIIIMHGPLYHIQSREKRIDLLSKANKFLKKKGILLGFAINRYAGYFYGVHSGHILNDAYKKIVIEELESGIRIKEPGWYFHKYRELIEEFEDSNFHVQEIKSVSSQLWMLPNINDLLSDEDKLNDIIQLANHMEDELEVGQDLLCMGIKNE